VHRTHARLRAGRPSLPPRRTSRSSCATRTAATTTLEKGRLGRQTAGQIIRHSSAGAYLSVLRCNERTVTPTYCSELPRVRARHCCCSLGIECYLVPSKGSHELNDCSGTFACSEGHCRKLSFVRNRLVKDCGDQGRCCSGGIPRTTCHFWDILSCTSTSFTVSVSVTTTTVPSHFLASEEERPTQAQ
jgi:hypothetical protein